MTGQGQGGGGGGGEGEREYNLMPLLHPLLLVMGEGHVN